MALKIMRILHFLLLTYYQPSIVLEIKLYLLFCSQDLLIHLLFKCIGLKYFWQFIQSLGYQFLFLWVNRIIVRDKTEIRRHRHSLLMKSSCIQLEFYLCIQFYQLISL
jgi:hypothetical protein